jgi:hypothetical protein
MPKGAGSGAARAALSPSLIVGSYGDYDSIGPRHCLWTAMDREPDDLPGTVGGSTTGAAWAVNPSGQIAGVSGGISGVFYAVRWDSPTAPPLRIGPLDGAMNSEAVALNVHGDVAGRSGFSDHSEAMLYVESSSALVPLGFLTGGSYSEAHDLNAHLWVVGTSNAPDARAHAVLWLDGAAYDLDDLVDPPLTGIEGLHTAAAVNDAGQIAAEGVVTGAAADFPRRLVVLTPAPP